MRIARWLLGLAVAVAVYVLGLRLTPHFSRAVDPFLVLVVAQSLGRRPVWSAAAGSLTGLTQDSLTGGLYGLHGFADTLVAYVCARLQQHFVFQQPLQVGLLFAFAAVLQLATVAALQFLLVSQGELPDLATLGLRTLTAGVLGLVVFVLGRRMQSWNRQRSRLRGRRVKLR